MPRCRQQTQLERFELQSRGQQDHSDPDWNEQDAISRLLKNDNVYDNYCILIAFHVFCV